jgi:hypothetical protein
MLSARGEYAAAERNFIVRLAALRIGMIVRADSSMRTERILSPICEGTHP